MLGCGREARPEARPTSPNYCTSQRTSQHTQAKSYVAMRYWYPFTSDALEAVKRDGIERLVVLPLYPQFSISTSGSSLRVLEQEFYADQELRQVRNRAQPAAISLPPAAYPISLSPSSGPSPSSHQPKPPTPGAQHGAARVV